MATKQFIKMKWSRKEHCFVWLYTDKTTKYIGLDISDILMERL